MIKIHDSHKKLVVALLMTVFCTLAYADHAHVLEEKLWGKLYKNGGNTFFCNEPFESKTPLISESYIYSSSWIKDHLQCGTKRQCNKNSPQYSKIMSDLHNIVIADAYLEFKRKNATYGDLEDENPIIKCDIRKSLYTIEPPDKIKGDIARTIFYMHQQYELPITMSYSLLLLWHQADPPDEAEKSRNKKIFEIQGNENPFINNPGLVHTISH